ncbi:hypothetical protein FRC05_010401 [Tulasnella sp. 425]|nr:hypothetical protein FRC05_010401 [Tulasnella sp. 425]
MVSFKTLFATLAAVIGANAAGGTLQQVTGSFGANPNNVGFYYYKPSKVVANPPLIVAIHYCTGSAQAYFSGTQYATLADTYGYIVIYPDSPRSGKCFDVNTPQTLSHNGGGDSQGIASMVTYAISTWGVNANRVYVTGTSSGAMMTNVMAGSGDLVRAAYPGYSGPRPRMMLWHGTADTTLYYPNLQQEINEWTNVLGQSTTPTTTTQNDLQSGYTHTTYGCVVQAYSAAGVGHTVPVHETIDLQWFGITSGGPSCVTGGTTPTTTPINFTPTPITSKTTTTPYAGTSAAHWGQCGGQGWTGPTVCVPPYTCQAANGTLTSVAIVKEILTAFPIAYYSQCL